ncbi:hypothetical protein CWI36_0298p0020 [Hamiltosporidium magnivora]|uniref:SLC26A/SulP transporter domain-containing protein n=1 Tax=Hamiltosporidium magnivora TaxID=148818 RepID=A0A4V2JWB0_9MICR|nr:hypothetical protein CWI36_0298p0020 [Hamiltosporidium magnivora]
MKENSFDDQIKKKRNIITIFSCIFLGLMFTLLDCLSYGRNMLPKVKDDTSIENISMIIYLYSTITAQIFYGIFTKLESGIMAGAIVESFPYMHSIFNVCKEGNESINSVVTNTLLCLLISTMLVSFWSFLLKKYKIGGFLKMIPKAAITGCLGAIGLSQFSVAYGEICSNIFDSKALLLLSIMVICAFIAFLLQEKFSDVVFIVPLFSLIVISGFYVFFIPILGNSLDNLILNEWLPKKESANLFLNQLWEKLSFKELSTKYVVKNIFNIFLLSLFSLIHMPVNLPAFGTATGVSFNFLDELKTQSIGNFISAFTFCPTYFISSCSIFFNRSGGKGKTESILLGVFLCTLIFFGASLKTYIPRFVLGMIPCFIGISMCYSAFIRIYSEASKYDLLVVYFTAFVSMYFNLVVGLIFGIFLCLLEFAFRYNKITKTGNVASDLELSNFRNNKFSKSIARIKVDFMLVFATVEKFDKLTRNATTYSVLVLDLMECGCIDWSGSDLLVGFVNGIDSNCKVYIIGKPHNYELYNVQKRFNKEIEHITENIVSV